MSSVARGPNPMLVVDASCLCEVVARGGAADEVAARLAADTAADAALLDLHECPGERFGHRPLLPRAWEVRAIVRGWDATYVALAEALDAPLITPDKRLAAATGPTCLIEVPG